MIIPSDDLTDWVADRDKLLIAAWTPELSKALEWETPFAEAFAVELHDAMMATMLKQGTEVNFVKLIARSGTGLDPRTEKAVADRFYNVTLKLARASSRFNREARSRSVFPYLRGYGVTDSRSDPGHAALHGIILPQQHPFWRKWHPPLDMDCRCGTIPMLPGQLARSGLAITSEEELADRESRLSAAWPPAFEPLLDFRRSRE